MGTDLVMTTMWFHRSRAVDCGRTDFSVLLVSEHFQTSEVVGLNSKTISNNKKLRSGKDVPTSATLALVLVYFHSGVLHIATEAVWRGYARCRGPVSNRNETRGKRPAEGVGSGVLLEEDLLRVQTEHAGELTEEALDSGRSLITAVRHSVPVSEEQFFQPGGDLADKVGKARRESVATICWLSEQKGKIEELELEVCLSIDDSVAVSDLEKQVDG